MTNLQFGACWRRSFKAVTDSVLESILFMSHVNTSDRICSIFSCRINKQKWRYRRTTSPCVRRQTGGRCSRRDCRSARLEQSGQALGEHPLRTAVHAPAGHSALTLDLCSSSAVRETEAGPSIVCLFTSGATRSCCACSKGSLICTDSVQPPLDTRKFRALPATNTATTVQLNSEVFSQSSPRRKSHPPG